LVFESDNPIRRYKVRKAIKALQLLHQSFFQKNHKAKMVTNKEIRREISNVIAAPLSPYMGINNKLPTMVAIIPNNAASANVCDFSSAYNVELKGMFMV
jgi:hypothetical protein